MSRLFLMIAVVLLVAGPSARSLAADSQSSGLIVTDPTRKQDKATDEACECCQKCKAAKSPIKTEEKEGAKLKDGCQDCCSKCGDVLKPTPETTPPEKIEKKDMPPETEEEESDE